MNYYFDTEFLEGKQDKKFFGIKYGETKPTIDLISIGIVAEDGREYYAISNEFNLDEAWNRCDIKVHEQTILNEGGENGDYCHYVYHNEDVQAWKNNHKNFKVLGVKGEKYKEYWIRENVLRPIYVDMLVMDGLSKKEAWSSVFSLNMFKFFLNKRGKSNKQIGEEIKKFIANYKYDDSWEEGPRYDSSFGNGVNNTFYYKTVFDTGEPKIFAGTSQSDKPKFYAYYAGYDWVVFCWIFGKMLDLPKGFPMFCIDLKQMFDEKANSFNLFYLMEMVGYKKNEIDKIYHNSQKNNTIPMRIPLLKSHMHYPKQNNEHNALDDARWNQKLHKFIKSI